ncbi:hypothetical protein [Longispora albida]|uniref:hypothetical protein n=1 Tax=Longispora albida TaxID=203523 RepID=UPI00035C7417|nr:hypothetical protein [Longispora albida]
MNAPSPSSAGSDRADLYDLVPGVPPVPLTVWRTPRTSTDPAGAVIPAHLATRLIEAYSAPGDQVIDLTDGTVLALPAVTGGRAHHAAWFTDTTYPYISPRATVMAEPGAEPDPDDVAFAQSSVIGTGNAALIVATWPLSADPVEAELRRAWLLATASKLLRPGGCLVLIAATAPGAVPVPEDFTPVVTAASAVSLGYLQHIAAVSAAVVGDEFVYLTDETTATPPPPDTGPNSTGFAPVHASVHADLFTFVRVGGEHV